MRANFSGSVLKVVSNINGVQQLYGDVHAHRRREQVASYSRSLRGTSRSSCDGTKLLRPASEVAQWNIYNGAPTRCSNSLAFVIPNGTQLVATLTSDLDRVCSYGDRFSIRAVSPEVYRDAMIEGYLSGVDRSGRFSGRSEMTFNFDRIRLRNGQTHNFAGIVDYVRTSDG